MIDLKRCSRNLPCPICGRADWCSVSNDGSICICMRVADGAKCQTRNGGYLHVLRDDGYQRPAARRIIIRTPEPPAINFVELAEKFISDITPDQREWLAKNLGVKSESLTSFCIGWDYQHEAFSFPMFNAENQVVGIRLRKKNGSKFSISGGHEGVFHSRDFWPRVGATVYVVEGASDAVAIHGIGIANVIGRPSCTGGASIIADIIRAARPGQVVVIADSDTPGIAGAEKLLHQVMLLCSDCRLITPPDGIKDVRAWVAAGANKYAIYDAVSTSPRRFYTLK